MIAGMLIYQTATGLPKSLATAVTTTTSPLTNKTIAFYDFTKLNIFMYNTSQFISLSLPTLICFIIVLVGTVFFIINFKQSRKMRITMGGSGQMSHKMSDKDARLVRLVIVISSVSSTSLAPCQMLDFMLSK